MYFVSYFIFFNWFVQGFIYINPWFVIYIDSLRFLSVLDGSRCFLSVISETPETWRNAPVAVRNLRKKLKDITGQKYVHVLKGLGKVLPRFCTIYMM